MSASQPLPRHNPVETLRNDKEGNISQSVLISRQVNDLIFIWQNNSVKETTKVFGCLHMTMVCPEPAAELLRLQSREA
ncbi:hypothetical protein C0Q70_01620 [Pomacea canaliculata]|uniref:Uncharacterized protein n=1 Tax=Pomacea canaliculata TaxID=400727 RepID=A0A2T7PZZ1_POMCA|nr:hypothetical protein C0Q70_01620 [Pomacea canaliculata]